MNRKEAEAAESGRDSYRLTASEMKPEYNDRDLWGCYLYKKHTEQGRHPIAPETAAKLTVHDLESILGYTAVAALDFEHDDIAMGTVHNCIDALMEREQG